MPKRLEGIVRIKEMHLLDGFTSAVYPGERLFDAELIPQTCIRGGWFKGWATVENFGLVYFYAIKYTQEW